MDHLATPTGFWRAMRLRQAASSVAPRLLSLDAPCVLPWLAPRTPEIRQRHQETH